MDIDHVLYGVSDLTAAASWLEDSFGLAPIGGGVHPGWGTANAIVPVGNRQYVELIAVVDRDSKHPLALALSAMIADGDRPVGLCLRSADLDDTARRLDLQVADGARTNPDGVQLRWRMAGLEVTLGPERLPFFVEWPGRGANPELEGAVAPAGNGVVAVEVGGDPDRLRQWIGLDVSTVVPVGGPPGIPGFSLDTGGDAIRIGPR